MVHELIRRLGLVVLLLAAAPEAYAQSCSGQAPSGAMCGNAGASQGLPSFQLLSPLIDRNFGAPSARGTILNRGASLWSATVGPVLGNPGTTTGTLGLASASGGTATLTPPAIAGNTALQLPTLAGTFPSTASSPLVLNATTGVLTCPTCVTGSAGALAVGTTTISGGSTGTVLVDTSGILQEVSYSTASAASSIVQRDTNQNAFFNNYFANATLTVSAGGTTVMTAASSRYQALSGSLSQTYQLPDATTLTIGPAFVFNNNSSGSLVIANAGGSTLYTVPAGGVVQGGPTNISTANGSWDFHPYPPSTVTWGSGTTGLVMNSALSTTPSIGAGAPSCTAPAFIPQRATSTTGYGGTSTSLCAIIGGAAAWTSTSAGTSVSNLTVTSSFTATGLVTNASLANPATTVNGQTCTLGSTCTVTAAAASIIVGTTTISSGTNTRILYNNAGTLGEYTITGTGTVVAMQTSPAFTTPSLGVATGTSLALGGCTIGSNALCATGTANITGPLTLGVAGGSAGSVVLTGSTSGTGTLRVAAVAGTGTIFQLPANNGTNTYVLQTDGSGVTSWVPSAGGGTVTSVGYAAGTGLLLSGTASPITSTGSFTFSADIASSAQFYSGASSKLVDSAIPYTTIPTPAFSATPTFNFATAASFAPGAMTANITSMTCVNLKANQGGFIKFTQDGSGGHTTVYCSAFKFQGGSAPALSTGAGAIDYLIYTCESSSVCPASLLKDVSWLYLPGVFSPKGYPANDNGLMVMAG